MTTATIDALGARWSKKNSYRQKQTMICRDREFTFPNSNTKVRYMLKQSESPLHFQKSCHKIVPKVRYGTIFEDFNTHIDDSIED